MKKNSSFLVLFLLVLASFTANAQNPSRGDVDDDGNVSISDVTTLIDYLINSDDDGINMFNADCDLDGHVSIADVTELIDYILSGEWSNGASTDEHPCVDLGLPSGTLWATMNVGANSPEEYGDYFAWGETEPKEVYSYTNYRWSDATHTVMTKYCVDSEYGIVDNKTALEPEDDAASVNWGASWCMPTIEQLEELVDRCTWEWTAMNGVNGEMVTGPNGNTMFLPAAGNIRNQWNTNEGSWGFYWLRDLYPDASNMSYTMRFFPEFLDWGNGARCNGLTVRAVRVARR